MGRPAAFLVPPALLGYLLIVLTHAFLSYVSRAQPGFVSIDCGSKEYYTDDLGISWASDAGFPFGKAASVSTPKRTRRQLTTQRYFPADEHKYCYTLPVKSRLRYLVRASFMYGDIDGSNVYPIFELSLGTSRWSQIVIDKRDPLVVREAIFLASATTVSVCVSNATTGYPFISSLELRQLNGSLYNTEFETQFFLAVSVRINFGAQSTDPVRYPDDLFDRIWESDIPRPNFLVGAAPGTIKVSTDTPVSVNIDETPPLKVMQTAVVGSNGSLTYRLNLEGFPGFGRAYSYLAEIQDLAPNETRRANVLIPGQSAIAKHVIDVQENARGKYKLYEPWLWNVSLEYTVDLALRKTTDSTRGPILNAIEISRYLPIGPASSDASIMSNFTSHYSSQNWAQEGGDPCLPLPWTWVQCSSDPQPRITSIKLSGKHLNGSIPSELTMLTGLQELWLDQNKLTGTIPDFKDCVSLKKLHLENNLLSGEIPPSLAELKSLQELYVQNNMLTGKAPSNLLNKDIEFQYYGNMFLQKGKSKKKLIIIVSCGAGVFVCVIAILAYCWLSRRGKKKNSEQRQNEVTHKSPIRNLSSLNTEVGEEKSQRFTLSELEEATDYFQKQVGSGGYGVVYYGKMKDGKEIAVKVLTSETYQGNRDFSNEVALISRIHHRNLVTFLGFCQQDGMSILVYEFMHNGTLKEHLFGPAAQKKPIGWLKRLQIAEDAAKGIEYLHTGCTPGIIHRDVKCSNILLDTHMRAKISDFGLSKVAPDGSAHASSAIRGTPGYLDPECFASQHLTEKSDVYSFGVILLELISGQEAISKQGFGNNCHYIVQWAQSQIESGNIQGIIDHSLGSDFNIQSVWKIAEIATSCVKPHGIQRPTVTNVLKEIQEAISIERGSDSVGKEDPGISLEHIAYSSYNIGNVCSDNSSSLSGSRMLPAAR